MTIQQAHDLLASILKDYSLASVLRMLASIQEKTALQFDELDKPADRVNAKRLRRVASALDVLAKGVQWEETE